MLRIEIRSPYKRCDKCGHEIIGFEKAYEWTKSDLQLIDHAEPFLHVMLCLPQLAPMGSMTAREGYEKCLQILHRDAIYIKNRAGFKGWAEFEAFEKDINRLIRETYEHSDYTFQVVV